MFGRVSNYLCERAQLTGYYYCPHEKKYRSSCSRAPLVLFKCNNDKGDLIIFLLRNITVLRVRARILFCPCVKMTYGVLFLSS